MRYLTIFSLIFCLFSLPLQAADYQGLYEAEVEVPDQGAGARSAGMRKAMEAVLLKVSGVSRAREDASLADAMQQPTRYVQQYRYRSEAKPAQLLLHVRFDQRSIDELLRQSGFSVWGGTRPSTLIWLGVEDGGRRVLVGDNDRGMVREIIGTEAARRALPVKLPLLDSTDRRKVSTADVWGEFLDTIKNASQRYAPQAILVGRLYPASSGRWEVRWSLDYRGEISRWQSQAREVAPLIAEGIDRVTDQIASNFVQNITTSDISSGEMLMRVEDVRNLKDYRRVVDYLKGVHGVKRLVVETLEPTAVQLRIAADSGMDAVLRIIALGDTLVKVEQPIGTAQPYQMPYQGENRTGTGMLPSGNGIAGSVETVKMAESPQPELFYRLKP